MAANKSLRSYDLFLQDQPVASWNDFDGRAFLNAPLLRDGLGNSDG